MAVLERPDKKIERAPQIWPLSVKAYHTLGDLGLIPEKTELLYGQVYRKMPKSPLHRLLVQRLVELLRTLLPAGTHLQSEQPLDCGNSEPEPDVSIIPGSINDYPTEHPRTAELVIEICVSSHDYDRSKLRAYAGANVKEVWLVLAPEKQIEIYRRPAGEDYAEHLTCGPGGIATSAVIPAFKVDLSAIFQP